MINFSINNCDYNCNLHKPNLNAKYGLAITFWKTNIQQLIFFLKYIDTWQNREFIDVSICSFMEAPEICSQYCNHIIKCSIDGGHQDGTTLQCNGAMYPFFQNDKIVTITHTDADQFVLNEQYFFGQSNILLDADKTILTSTVSYDFKNKKIVPHEELGKGVTEKQFGAFFVLNKRKNNGYWPFIPKGNFESDRYEQFVKKFPIDEALILKRLEFSDRNCNMKHLDFHLGVFHNASAEHNLLDLMGKEIK